MNNRIYFFEKRNPYTGAVLEIVDCEERVAWSYWNVPLQFRFIGWSDGRFITAIRNKSRLETDEKTKMKIAPSEELQSEIREAYKQEVEFARNNPDRNGPRDLTKKFLGNAQGTVHIPNQKESSILNQASAMDNGLN